MRSATGASGPSHFTHLGFAARGLACPCADCDAPNSSWRAWSRIHSACFDLEGSKGRQASQRSRASCRSPWASSERAWAASCSMVSPCTSVWHWGHSSAPGGISFAQRGQFCTRSGVIEDTIFSDAPLSASSHNRSRSVHLADYGQIIHAPAITPVPRGWCTPRPTCPTRRAAHSVCSIPGNLLHSSGAFLRKSRLEFHSTHHSPHTGSPRSLSFVAIRRGSIAL